ncbi:MAG: DUF697 domain-containing protein [Desulfobacteraceae bacterium]|nr:DUF697 domain-containing protein [Desulfobacteraceae bacterium]
MERRTQADKIVKKHVLWAIGGGVVPIPLLDIAAVSLVQVDMLKQLCRLYGVSYSESKGKAILSAVAGSSLASVGASAIKTIPWVGTILGGVSMPILSGASTYALAQAIVLHFESDGNLFDIDMEMIKKVYKENFKKGKEFASNLKKKHDAGSSSDDDDDLPRPL